MSYEWKRLSGSVIGQRYVLGEIVSERVGSATFLTDLPGDERAVIEVMAAESRESDLQLHRWSVARGLTHTHLIQIYGAGAEALDHANFVYAVKERPDECLADVIATRTLTVDETRNVVEAILLSLEFLHDKGLAHGAVEPLSIMAVGGTIKLTLDAISGPTPSRLGAGQDMFSLGATITEVLTRQRPAGGVATALPKNIPENIAENIPKNNALVKALPSPFREIAIGCLQPDEAQRWTPRQGSKYLAANLCTPPSVVNRDPRRESFPRSFLKRPGPLALLAFASILGVVMLVRSTGRQANLVNTTSKRVYHPVSDDRPSPIPAQGGAEREAASNVQVNTDAAVRSHVAAPKVSGSNWGVIAATYRDFDVAQRFANSLQTRGKGLPCAVYPLRGQGEKYYYVLLGSGLTENAAQLLRRRALAAGFPENSYVTKIATPQGVDGH